MTHSFLFDFCIFLTVISRDISDSSNSDLQNIMSELEKLKSFLNQTELQLYEANEHISDLLEKASFDIFVFMFSQSFNIQIFNRNTNWK